MDQEKRSRIRDQGSHDDTRCCTAEWETYWDHGSSTFLPRLLLRLHSLLARVRGREILALSAQLRLPGGHVCSVLCVEISGWVENGRSRGGSAPHGHLVFVPKCICVFIHTLIIKFFTKIKCITCPRTWPWPGSSPAGSCGRSPPG